jgi:hypothetical protein
MNLELYYTQKATLYVSDTTVNFDDFNSGFYITKSVDTQTLTSIVENKPLTIAVSTPSVEIGCDFNNRSFIYKTKITKIERTISYIEEKSLTGTYDLDDNGNPNDGTGVVPATVNTIENINQTIVTSSNNPYNNYAILKTEVTVCFKLNDINYICDGIITNVTTADDGVVTISNSYSFVSTTVEKTRITSINVNVNSIKQVDYCVFCKPNLLTIFPKDDFTKPILKHLINRVPNVNLHTKKTVVNNVESKETFVTFSKQLDTHEKALQGENNRKWFADIYLWDKTTQRFIRKGNDKGNFKKVETSEDYLDHQYVSYYPPK